MVPKTITIINVSAHSSVNDGLNFKMLIIVSKCLLKT